MLNHFMFLISTEILAEQTGGIKKIKNHLLNCYLQNMDQYT
jgi:hypothetical protein